jgi:hypothetical protein
LNTVFALVYELSMALTFENVCQQQERSSSSCSNAAAAAAAQIVVLLSPLKLYLL